MGVVGRSLSGVARGQRALLEADDAVGNVRGVRMINLSHLLLVCHAQLALARVKQTAGAVYVARPSVVGCLDALVASAARLGLSKLSTIRVAHLRSEYTRYV